MDSLKLSEKPKYKALYDVVSKKLPEGAARKGLLADLERGLIADEVEPFLQDVCRELQAKLLNAARDHAPEPVFTEILKEMDVVNSCKRDEIAAAYTIDTEEKFERMVDLIRMDWSVLTGQALPGDLDSELDARAGIGQKQNWIFFPPLPPASQDSSVPAIPVLTASPPEATIIPEPESEVKRFRAT